MSAITHAIALIKMNEGFRAHPYRCAEGKLTIGYGTNLEDRGISREEAETLLFNDVLTARDRLERCQWWEYLNDARKAAILDMCYQLGISGFFKFKQTVEFMDQKLFGHAAKEMLNSKWATQTPERASRISQIIRDGQII